jgi:hypothetical protein
MVALRIVYHLFVFLESGWVFIVTDQASFTSNDGTFFENELEKNVSDC